MTKKEKQRGKKNILCVSISNNWEIEEAQYTEDKYKRKKNAKQNDKYEKRKAELTIYVVTDLLAVASHPVTIVTGSICSWYLPLDKLWKPFRHGIWRRENAWRGLLFSIYVDQCFEYKKAYQWSFEVSCCQICCEYNAFKL